MALILPVVVIGNSLLVESDRYVLILGDEHKFQNDAYIEFYQIDSKENRQVIIDKGTISIGNEEYEIIEDWKGSFLNDDKLFFMAGSAESFDKKIDVLIIGKFLEKAVDGNLYDITVHIHSDQTVEFQTEGQIIGISPKENLQKIPPEIKSEKPLNILFLINDSHHRFQDEEYVFTTKVYDKNQNPLGEWNVKGGEIKDAYITVQAMDLDGNALREIHGNTNDAGWFEGKFPLGETFPRGEYLIRYTAKYQNVTVENNKSLYVFEFDRNSSTRHFTPTLDITKGHWNDNKGNQNGLMYDDLDEYPRDDTYYVHSRGLGTNQVEDTLHLKISNYAGGVTADHQHIISYTIRKDSPGGNEIKFTVTLFDGTSEIAQWTHLNIDENFKEITNILTVEQKNGISDYTNLSLKFVAECSVCGGGNDKREGQISWVHMVV
ncbi:Hypothetical protein Nlim_0737 [Candidatus Nitrosarchaeum limnium SFB1]|jgi:hypothetical protein|uniref:Uncharacterized protein n=1 Tax=Candidatus Nitrosarchaeum limnium SFB1 TaxID=886738 RepID=F3KJS9_9ARCH|nr:Hypothetical protein Nlim_0737 [Candidatus Nitrosarchaeum limnium SFB1]